MGPHPRRAFVCLPLSAALAVCLAARPARAQASPASTAAAAEALEALYDLDYGRSLALIGEQTAAHPDQPFLRLFDAGVLWWWASSEPGLFRSSAPLAARFHRDVSEALSLTAPRLEDPDPQARADALFVAGLTRGLEAQDDLAEGRWFRAYLTGRKGRKLLAACLEAEPGYYDADLGIGLYDYLAAHLPGVLKVGALLFVRGDAAGGLARLRLAAEKGRYAFAATQAASNLVSLEILDEGDYGAALADLKPLLAAYPRSPYFRFVQALALYRQGDWTASRRLMLDLWEDPAAGRRRLSLICGLDGAACFSKPALTAAEDWLTRALDDPAPAPAGWRASCRLYRGAAYDLLKLRTPAVEDYRSVAEDTAAGAEEKGFAERCLKKACRAPDVAALLRGEHAG